MEYEETRDLKLESFEYVERVTWTRYSTGFSGSCMSTIYNYKRALAEDSIGARHPRRQRIDRVLRAYKRHHIAHVSIYNLRRDTSGYYRGN